MAGTKVSVTLAYGPPLVVLSGPDREALDAFAGMYQVFLAAAHAPQGLAGVSLCKATEGCWDPDPVENQPWAFFLPLDLPMTGQRAVTFLNHPPHLTLSRPGSDDSMNYRGA